MKTVTDISDWNIGGNYGLQRVVSVSYTHLVPGKLIFVDDFLGEVYDNDNYENFPITVKTVKFTTQLSDKPMYKFYLTHKFIVSKKDKKYRSYKGRIYTKNGKKFVAMPSECKILKIRKGCKIVNVVGFSYESYNEESCSDDPDYYILTCCKKLKKVIIPSTVKSYYCLLYTSTGKRTYY